MKIVKLIVLLFCISSCAPIYVTYDYDKKKDFSKFKTYNYYSNIETDLNEFDNVRIMNALDDVMQQKGLKLSSKPDFYIDIQSVEYNPVRQNTVGVGLGGGGRNVGGGISIGLPIGKQQTNRQFVFEFIEEGGVGLFWKAVSESKFNVEETPEKKEALIEAIVLKMMEKYPPKKN